MYAIRSYYDIPERHNALGTDELEAIRRHLEVVAGDEQVRVLIVTGAGHKSFCAGASLQQLDAGDVITSYSIHYTKLYEAIGFAESLAITHGDQGIGVSVLCPQAVATRMIQQAGDGTGGTAGVDGVLSAEQVAEAAVRGLAAEEFLILPHKEVVEYRLV